jgi:L-2,4-diaminobutyrate decarboxylase
MREELLKKIKASLFLSDMGGNIDKLLDLCKISSNSLAKNQGNGALFPAPKRTKLSKVVEISEIPLKYNQDFKSILNDLNLDVQGAVNVNSPFTVKNIIPQPNFIYLATYLSTSLYMLNAVTGENSAEGLNAEIASASAISKLAGYDPRQSAGVYTFSGTGTSLYGIKIGLSKASPDHSLGGIADNNLVVIGPKSSHYSQQNVVNWLGIGKDNYILVPTNLDQTIKITELEGVCREALSSGKKIACILLSGGTTSNMAIDDFEEVYNVRNKLVEDFKLDYVPHIHVDSVIGWVYLNFKNYDFEKNVLEFSPKALEIIKLNYQRMSKLEFADSFGVDFHKTGFVPYNSSMILVKDKKDFSRLEIDFKSTSPLFHDEEAYDPGKFTLETSRSCANIIATWKTLQTLGQEGYQVLIGNSLEMAIYFREQSKKYIDAGLFIVNQDFFGCDVFLRCYPPNLNQKKLFDQEQTDNDLTAEHNRYTSNFFKWFSNDYQPTKSRIAIGKTNSALYNQNGFPFTALRIYILNPNLTKSSLEYILSEIVKAKEQYDVLITIHKTQIP